MRVLVITDVHANIVALDAILQEAGAFDVIWSLGDLVGYGPEPNACIERLCEFKHVAIPGNHDWGVLGLLDLSEFNHDARSANLWTREQLTDQNRAYLEGLPETSVQGDYTLAHGSPRHPIWEYLFYANTAKASFDHFDTLACLVGHTHVPVIFQLPEGGDECGVLPVGEGPLALRDATLRNARYIINPGGVGQPRDGDPRAAFALLDTETSLFEHRRVEYDIAATQERMRALGLPPRLSARLSFGW